MANLFSLIFSFSFVVWSFENSEDTISFSLLHPDRHPVILSIKTKSLNPTTGEIEFETDDETKSEIEFGLAEDYGSRIEGTWNLKHRFIIPALKEGIYHFKVKAKDRDGNEVESLDQSFEIEGLIPPLFKDLFEEERELQASGMEHGGWSCVEGTWWSKWGKFFPYFKEEISKDELEKPISELKKDSSEHVLPFSQVLPFLPDFELKDYLVEFKLRPDYNQAKFGIAVRYNPEDGSGYYLWIEQIKQSRASGYKLQASGLKNLNYNITLEKKTKGKSTILQDTIYTNTLRWFIIEVMVDGERIEVSVDGKKVIRVRDSEIQKGKIALITEQRLPLTVIDDFVVRQIQKKSMFTKKQSGKEIQAKAQSEITLNPSSNFIPSTPAENIYAHKEGGKGPNAGNGYIWSELYEPLNFPTLELETLNPEPSLALVYQTTSALPSSELLLYYHHDHLGNIRVVTDQNRNVVERHDFYPFGEEITTQPQNTDQYLFTGKPRDSETGLDYFGARYYSSSFSRWLSPDTIKNLKATIQNPQKWNLYVYVINNPIKFLDPEGNEEKITYFITVHPDPVKFSYLDVDLRDAIEAIRDSTNKSINLNFYLTNKASMENFIAELFGEGNAMIAFYGHTRYNTIDSERIPTGLKFNDNVLDSNSIEPKVSLPTDAKIVFLASCKSTANNSQLSYLFGIFNDTKGQALVGFQNRVNTVAMAKVLEKFSEFVMKGMSVGEAVKKINEWIKKPENIKNLGRAQLTIIGDPNVKIN